MRSFESVSVGKSAKNLSASFETESLPPFDWQRNIKAYLYFVQPQASHKLITPLLHCLGFSVLWII